MVAARTPPTAVATPLLVAHVDDGATLLTACGMAPLRVHDLPDLDDDDDGDGFVCDEDSVVEVPANAGLGAIGEDQPI